jgi:2-keto-myo-inositol isomerase
MRDDVAPSRTSRALASGSYLNGATLMTTPTDRLVQIARAAGYDGVEVRAERTLEDADEVRRASAQLRPGEVWSLNGIRVGIDADGSLERETLEADLEPRLAVCRALGAAYLLVVPPRVPGLDPALAIASVRKGLVILRDRLLAEGIGVAFEFLGFFDSPIDTPERAGRVVEGIEGVDLVLDSCHWHASGSAPLERFPVERLAMVHLNDAPAKDPARIEDAERLLPGEGVIRLRELLADLGERGYRGPYSLETFNPDHWAAPPERIAARGLNALRSLVGPA